MTRSDVTGKPRPKSSCRFGEAKVVYRGREIKAMFRAFEFFRGVPNRISYDNSRIAVAKIGGIYVELPDEDSNLGQSG